MGEDMQEENNDFRQLCISCLRPVKACFCSYTKPFETKTRFVLLMHPKEAKKERHGTGRMSSIILKNSEIIIGINFDQDRKVQAYLSDSTKECYLLYPGDHSHNISQAPLEKTDKERVIFIIDGTWPCAKNMMKRSTCLHQLPRISFDSSLESKFKIKQQPAKYCLSTIESLYVLVNELNKQGEESLTHEHQNLMEVFERFVSFQIDCANDPNLQGYRRKQYKLPSERKPYKKWKERNIIFKEALSD